MEQPLDRAARASDRTDRAATTGRSAPAPARRHPRPAGAFRWPSRPCAGPFFALQ